jgi:hypothetical protein
MKGSLLDLGIPILILVAFVFSLFLISLFYGNIKTGLMNSVNSTMRNDTFYNTTVPILNAGSSVFDIFINSIPLLVFGSGISMFILAFLIPTHPVFMPISIVVLIIYVVVSVVFSNILWAFINNSSIITIANNYPVVVGMIQFSPYIMAIIGTLLIIVMYSKRGIQNE